MVINKQSKLLITYVLNLTTEELRDLSNALHDAIDSRRDREYEDDQYPLNKYRELQYAIEKVYHSFTPQEVFEGEVCEESKKCSGYGT